MDHKYSLEDRRYLESFESFTLKATTFHHRQHLRIAYVLIVEFGLEGAFTRLKSGLLRLLVHLGVGTEKYHETITYAWLLAVNHFMHTSRHASTFDEFLGDNAILLDSGIMNTHYSKELLQTAEARATFVEPDLDPIPRHS